MAGRVFLPVKNDIVFHMFFTDEKNKDSLIAFLKAILVLPDDDYEVIEISDPHLLRDYNEDKLGIVDVKLRTKSKKIINIEIQLRVTPELKRRIIFYNAKLVTEQIGSGDDYDVINKAISILITDEILIANSPKYHHRFRFYDPEAGVELTDLVEIHSLELRKLPESTDGTDLYNWARFIAANSEEDMTMLAESSPQLSRAVVRYRELTADERAREIYEYREKARRDYNSEIKWAKEQGIQQGIHQGENIKALSIAQNALLKGMPIADIADITGLTFKEIEDLRNLN
jgi:predicted transposase/invertase (TIGR01784 family)